MHAKILSGEPVTEVAKVGSRQRTRINYASLGLESNPQYLNDISVAMTEYVAVQTKLQAANQNADAKAAAAWLKQGAKDTFKTFAEQAAYDEEQKVEAVKEARYEKALSAIKNEY